MRQEAAAIRKKPEPPDAAMPTAGAMLRQRAHPTAEYHPMD
jgi:hypothetical protein